MTVGILGAFLLNEWGKSRERQTVQREVLEQIRLDLEENLNDLRNDFVIHQKALGGHQRLEAVLNGKKPFSAENIFDLYWIKSDEYIFANTAGYDNLKALGVDLVESDSIRHLISRVYNHDFPRLTRGNTFYPDINEYLSPYYQTHFKVNRDTSLKHTLTLNDSMSVTFPYQLTAGEDPLFRHIGFVPEDLDAWQQDESFRFLLSEVLNFRTYKYAYYRTCIADVELLIRLISQEEKRLGS